MNAAEMIAAAIEKLADLRDATTTDEGSAPVWRAEHHRIGGAAIFAEDDNALAVGLDDTDAELIVTLHRTIDAQLALLRELHNIALNAGWSDDEFPSKPGHEHGLALAKAILGEVS